MRRFQKLKSSVATLVVVVLAIVSFARGTLQLILLSAAFLTWGIYAFISFLLPIIARQKQRRELRRVSEGPQKKAVSTEDNHKLNYLLLCHVNHRITGYIKSTYPDATWAWKINNPADIMANGGTGRIELFGIKDFNFADISFDSNANIECSLLKVVSLKHAVQKECKDAQADIAKSEIDPQVWFDKTGHEVLKKIIADLSSRGHNSLTIQDDGSCIITQGDKTITVRHLEAFPEKVYHPKLIKVLAGAGIAAKSVDAGLAVTW